jgi:hypothetical protein
MKEMSTSLGCARLAALLQALLIRPQIQLQAIKARVPELPVVLQPLVHLAQRITLNPAGPPLGRAATRNQPGKFADRSLT